MRWGSIMGFVHWIIRLCPQGAAWAAGCLSLSIALAVALPFGNRAAATTIYHVVMPRTVSSSVFLAADARVIDRAPAFASAYRYTIAADRTIGPTALYRAGAWLVLSGTAPGCGPAATS